jgi:hypothetical protein
LKTPIGKVAHDDEKESEMPETIGELIIAGAAAIGVEGVAEFSLASTTVVLHP